MSNNDQTRRTFLQTFLLGGTGLSLACTILPRQFRLNKPVLKYPETADEIADLWDLFAEPAFTADAAVKGLNITGTPETMKQGEDTLWVTYPKQSDLIRSVRIDHRNGEIDEMFITYETPISISLGRLEFLFGEPRNFRGPVGSLSLFDAPAPAANRNPGQGPRGPYYMQFSFEARHALADGRSMQGRVGVSADGDYKLNIGGKTRNVISLEFQKYPNL